MKLQINGTSFDLQPAFREGHQLTRAEAQALEGLRLDRIRDGLAKIERKRGERLTQSEVDRFAAEWGFEPKAETAWRRSEVDQELRGLAELRAASEGLAPGDRGWEDRVEESMQDAGLREQARARVAARRELLQRELDSLVA